MQKGWFLMDYNVISNGSVVVLIDVEGNNFIVRDLTNNSEATISPSKIVCEQGKYPRYVLEQLVSSVISDSNVPIARLVTEDANKLLYQVAESNCTLF